MPLQHITTHQLECCVVVGGMRNAGPCIAEEAFERQVAGNPKATSDAQGLIGSDEGCAG